MTDLNISIINQLQPEVKQALIWQDTLEKMIAVILVVAFTFIIFR